MGRIRQPGVAVLLAAALVMRAAPAATVTVTVVDGAKQPLPAAVLTLVPADGGTLPARPADNPAHRPAMRQRGEQFEPFILAVQTGTVVAFPNEDPVRHHVFSFSAPKPFELRLYGREQVPTVTFDKAGIVAVGCNIHDHMRGYVYVVDTPLFASTDAKGIAVVGNVPPGRYTATLWHPRIRTPGAKAGQDVTIGAPGDEARLQFDVRLGEQPRPSPPDPERGGY